MGKFISDITQYLEATRAFSTFSKTHNITRKDIGSLFIFCEDLEDSEKINGLKRNIIIRFFSMVEGDIYHLNKIDPYPNYNDRNDFDTKFKSTIKQVFTTWERTEALNKYRDTKIKNFWILKNWRDKITHPKTPEDLNTESLELKFIKSVFTNYQDFLLELVRDFFISTDMKTMITAAKLSNNTK
ncbi:hypothetical protein [Algoriphagus pacificus]|uniref:RiboL-PSP-HEPN domain-containing protein n=1 Tax=Algoriphagus pacificus TaxID=2811234 RepID=A0ABS3CAR9_9BACT|nr:hypothetical protein [Algoriphagus pacificus]MBN7814207.1 hypothetical protein [Algoriphagus pacificus]